MTNILRIDASARKEGSLTRMLADEFMDRWSSHRPATQVTHRDVGMSPPEAISEAWMAAAFTPPASRTQDDKAILRQSDEYIAELRAADLLLIASPMYNYGMPASLKAWVDQIVRIEETFTFDLSRGDRPLEPILSNKTLVLMTASGEFGFEPNGFNDGNGHLVPHVMTVSKYLGVNEAHHIGIEYQEFKDDRFETSKAAAIEACSRLVEKLNKSI